jgi:alpha-mannosidase
MRYKEKYFVVIKDQGIFKKGMTCYCFNEQEDFIWVWFQNPLFGDFHEAKISKENMSLFQEKSRFLLDR